jgi:hypothetical protein
MPGNPRDMITVAERRFPVRIRIGVPPGGFGQRYAQITAWLDENCGADGWAMTPSGMRGVLNDAVSIYFRDATLANAFVTRWCAGYKIETTDGVFRVRDDEPATRVGAGLHRTPREEKSASIVFRVWLLDCSGHEYPEIEHPPRPLLSAPRFSPGAHPTVCASR